MDVRLPGITAEGETARSLGPAATGILTVLGPFHVDVVAEALQALVVERIVSLRSPSISIDAKFVLAQPYNYDRMIRAVQLRQREIAAGPIRVSRVIVSNLPDHYIVSEGAHRSFAARQRGDLMIDAMVTATLHAAPEQFRVVGDTLMRCTCDGTFPVSPSGSAARPVGREAARLSRDVIHVLAAMGCAVYPESQYGVVSQELCPCFKVVGL
jgi:hypothetical protein